MGDALAGADRAQRLAVSRGQLPKDTKSPLVNFAAGWALRSPPSQMPGFMLGSPLGNVFRITRIGCASPFFCTSKLAVLSRAAFSPPSPRRGLAVYRCRAQLIFPLSGLCMLQFSSE